MNYGLDTTTIARIQEVLSHHRQVQKAILYGSRARGNHQRGSDIDLALQGGSDLDLSVLYRIMDDIDDLLLPYTFDIALMHLINDREVLDHIEQLGAVFYEQAPESHVA